MQIEIMSWIKLIENKNTQIVYNTFDKRLAPPNRYSIFSKLLPVQLSKHYQFKITIRQIIPENIKPFELNTKPHSCTRNF